MRLIALELTLKDLDPSNRVLVHDVIEMLTKLDDSNVSSLALRLKSALELLRCVDRKGLPANVQSKKYPDLRYLRHEQDFPGETTDLQLGALCDAIDDLWEELLRKGIAP